MCTNAQLIDGIPASPTMDGQQAPANTMEQSIAAVHLKQKEEAARLGFTHRDYSFAVCTLQNFGRPEFG
mgnify:CR=1 FL=1